MNGPLLKASWTWIPRSDKGKVFERLLAERPFTASSSDKADLNMRKFMDSEVGHCPSQLGLTLGRAQSGPVKPAQLMTSRRLAPSSNSQKNTTSPRGLAAAAAAARPTPALTLPTPRICAAPPNESARKRDDLRACNEAAQHGPIYGHPIPLSPRGNGATRRVRALPRPRASRRASSIRTPRICAAPPNEFARNSGSATRGDLRTCNAAAQHGPMPVGTRRAQRQRPRGNGANQGVRARAASPLDPGVPARFGHTGASAPPHGDEAARPRVALSAQEHAGAHR
ncbi:hypothetical protein B0H15DRAFT_944829 [Mycena belliarum]|uniref:Uncharacterized protein n=1 Tax=Mycena belliarum TaxID=1033014 RepID=A0AAD6UFE1_9AGAR|nr:hypothetical protein B0H15DRAFT_944825 [Mycena belliae]KAJ7099410.1 hypothetical protein B0H15DRAFT_944829 [Mycena belliae]